MNLSHPLAAKALHGGVLHFDLLQGCRARLLLAALFDLGVSQAIVDQALNKLGLPKETVRLQQQKKGQLTGCTLQIKQALADDQVPLSYLAQRLAQSSLEPVEKALAQRIYAILNEGLAALSHSDSSFKMPQHVLEEWAILTALLTCVVSVLNPKAVSASRIAIGQQLESEGASDFDSFLLSSVLFGVPILERDAKSPNSDALGVAMMRALAHRFGARGGTTMVAMGMGLDDNFSVSKELVRVYASQAARTMGATEEALPSKLAIHAVLGQMVDVPELIRRLEVLGMRSIRTVQVMEHASAARMALSGLVDQNDVQHAVKALLVTGEARDVRAHPVEVYALSTRVVAVPYGRGVKQQSIRVHEYALGDQVVRIDPDSQDIAALVEQSGLVPEILRSDVMMAYKRFRNHD